MLLAAQRVVDASGQTGRGWFRVDGELIRERGGGDPPAVPDVVLGDVLPGFVDQHAHGAAQVDFGTLGADPAPAIAFHARAGVTSLMASLATAPLDVLCDRLAELGPVVRAGELSGLHLEGPWLSPARKGAHAAEQLCAPRPDDVDRLLSAADGALRMVTLAPELPGALAAIRRLHDAGIVVAIGHTDATGEWVRRALDAGATVFTHLFNGMPSLHHREPGPVGVALADPDATVEIILDGAHVDDSVVNLVRTIAAGRLALVSDAMSATGAPDGRYRLAGSDVLVRDGVALLADGSSLAGSTTPLGRAAQRLLTLPGADLVEVASASSIVPARTLGLAPRRLEAGSAADLVEIVDGSVARVLRRGRWVEPHPAAPAP